jgi:glutaredoxin
MDARLALVLAVLIAALVAAVELYNGHTGSMMVNGAVGEGTPTPTASTVTAGSSCSSGNVCVPVGSLYLVELGTAGCPHCRAMKEFLPGLGVEAYFCEVGHAGSACAKAFMKMFTAGITSGVPVIVACSNLTKTVVFIEIGEYKDKTWWLNMLHNPPSKPAVYEAGKLRTVLDPVLQQELSSLVCEEALKEATRLS